MKNVLCKVLVLEVREMVTVDSIVTEEEITVIRNKVTELTKYITIQEVRDGVVEYSSDRKLEFRELGNWEQFDSYNNTMSKIVAVIDLMRE